MKNYKSFMITQTVLAVLAISAIVIAVVLVVNILITDSHGF